MDTGQLADRFCATWARCTGGADPSPVWQTVEKRYTEPHRFYHNLDHLDHCLGELDAAREKIEELDATELAIWFHDIIYVYGAKDNEERSADALRYFAASHLPANITDRVSEFIVATKHTGAAADLGIAYLVDIDLSGFGLPWEGYLADSNALRKEAPEVSDEQYYRGKLRFLTELQTWDSLFQTDFFRERLEANAQANITRYSGDLRAKGFG